MSPLFNQPDEESSQIQKCLNGDAEAIAGLRNKHQPALTNILVGRGANRTEAEDLLADLWADCIFKSEDRPSLLEKFSHKCALQSWLSTVALRRLIDLKRRQKFRGEPVKQSELDSRTDFFERVPSTSSPTPESALIDMLRTSLQGALESCGAEALLILRLVYLHGVTQREVGRMFGWHESKVSRAGATAMKHIQTATLGQIQKKDPWLQLSWEDFLALCETHQVGFL